MREDFLYETSKGYSIPISLYGAEYWGTRPCIVYIHGFKGFKDWGFVPYCGEYLVKEGFCFVCFNFSHNGIVGHADEFTAFDKFEQNSFSLEVSEAKEMIHLCMHTDFFGRYSVQKIGVIGHSRGGGISILSCSGNQDVSALVTWASVSSFDRFDKKTREDWRKKGYIEVMNSRTKQVFRLGRKLLEDVERHTKTRLNVLEAVRSLEKPLLILHGSDDKAVGYYEAEQLNIYSSAAQTQFRLIPGAGHTFGAKHPFVGTTPDLELVLELSSQFFRASLY